MMRHFNQPQTNQEAITKEIVNTSYESYAANHCTNTKVPQIIRILGGIECILDEFFCEQSVIQITQSQMNRLHQLFTSNNMCKQRNKNIMDGLTQIPISAVNNDENVLYNYESHVFNVSDTYLHAMFGDVFATKIFNILHSRWPHIVFIVLLVIHVVLRFSINNNNIIYPLYTIIVWGIFCSLYLFCWMFSINRKGSKLIIQCFEFWLKVVIGTVAMVLVLINKFVFHQLGADHIRYKYLQICGQSLELFLSVCIIITVSMFDALHIKRASKILFSANFALVATIFAIYNEYILYFNGNKSVVYLSNNFGFCLLSMQQNAFQVVALFTWKQTIFSVIRRDRSVLIKHSPYIEWNTNTNIPKVTSIIGNDDIKNQINKNMVRESFQLYKNQCKYMDESRIIEILGGMEFILKAFLRAESDIHISKNRLHNLQKIFISPSNYPQHTKNRALSVLSSSLSTLYQHESILHNYNSHIFDVSDTCLHNIFEEELTTKATHVLNSVWFHLSFCFMFASMAVIRYTLGVINLYYKFITIYLIIFVFVMSLYVILWLLSINKKGAILLMHTFEFWLKLVCVIILGASRVMTVVRGMYLFPNNDTVYIYVALCGRILFFVNVTCIIIIVSMFDALHIKRALKVVLSCTLAIIVTYTGIHREYNLYFNGRDMLYNADTTNEIVSLWISLETSAWKVLILFLWKQTVLTVIRGNRSVIIKHSPYIEWHTNTKTSNATIMDDNEKKATADKECSVLYIDPMDAKSVRNDDKPIDYSSQSGLSEPSQSSNTRESASMSQQSYTI